MPLMRRNTTIRRSRAAGWARLAGGLALPVLVLGVVGVRAGVVPQVALQPVIVAGFALGVLALGLAAFALADIWVSGAEGAGSAVIGITYASPVLAILALVAAAALIYPRITDVVTDAADPPRFTAPEAPHVPPDAATIARQEAGYPDLAPKIYPLPLGDVYVAARKIIDDNHWQVIREVRPAELPMATSRTSAAAPAAEDEELTKALAAKSVMTQSRSGAATETTAGSQLPASPGTGTLDPADGDTEPDKVATVEVMAATPIFHFLDDVVIRLKTNDDGSTQVDMRSASRYGAHDLGENARRIKGFYAKLDAALQPDPGTGGIASASQ
jgi:hypothetical protein